MRLREVFEKLSERIAYTELSEEAVEEIGYDFILELVENDVAYEVAEALIKELAKRVSKEKVPRFSDKKKLVREELKKLLYKIFEEAGRLDLEKQLSDKVRRGEKPQTILFLGPNGHGKTTTIAKLANRYKKKGFSVVIVAADTFRAGAIEQIKKWSEKIGVPLISHGYGADPAAVAYDALLYAKKNNIDIVLVDTAGRMHTNVNLLDEMKKIVRVLEPD
ncbi:MAG: signal recognition particle-docking protein FtsY, partial [Thermoprotei archaeon]